MTTPKRLWALLMAPAIAISVGLSLGLWLSSGSTGGRSASYRDGYAYALRAYALRANAPAANSPLVNENAQIAFYGTESQVVVSPCSQLVRQAVPAHDDRREWARGCEAATGERPWLLVLVPNVVGRQLAAHQALLYGEVLLWRVDVLPPTSQAPHPAGYVVWQRPKTGSYVKVGSVVVLGVSSGP